MAEEVRNDVSVGRRAVMAVIESSWWDSRDGLHQGDGGADARDWRRRCGYEMEKGGTDREDGLILLQVGFQSRLEEVVVDDERAEWRRDSMLHEGHLGRPERGLQHEGLRVKPLGRLSLGSRRSGRVGEAGAARAQLQSNNPQERTGFTSVCHRIPGYVQSAWLLSSGTSGTARVAE